MAVVTLTFVAMLSVITFEVLHKTMAALLGMAVVFGISLVGGWSIPTCMSLILRMRLNTWIFKLSFW
jgi:hypothetical protein